MLKFTLYLIIKAQREEMYKKVKVKVSHNRPRWPKGFRVG